MKYKLQHILLLCEPVKEFFDAGYHVMTSMSVSYDVDIKKQSCIVINVDVRNVGLIDQYATGPFNG